MSDAEWDSVNKSEVVRESVKEHKEMLAYKKDSYLTNLDIIMGRSSGERKKLTKEERAAKFKSESKFRHNAFFLFDNATEMATERYGSDIPTNVKEKLNQMLHSILFLGNIHSAQYKPKDIFAETEVFERTKNDFPTPFTYYQTHVAKRTPFSYFLELVTICYDQNNENMVKGKLCEILRGCKKSADQYPLISVVICICESGESRYYGASLSCESDREREIMTGVSCLHVWHPLVSSAVMSVFSADTGGVRTIQFQTQCQCRAYAVENMAQEKPPCGRCSQLYSLPNPDPEDIDFRNPAGNCAETEAISNLLLKNRGVADQTIITGGVYEEGMTACFNRNMNEIMGKRSRGNRNEYNINTFYP